MKRGKLEYWPFLFILSRTWENSIANECLLYNVDVYIRYKFEEDAQKAVDALNTRFYAGRPLYAELSPVTDFGEGKIRFFLSRNRFHLLFQSPHHLHQPNSMLPAIRKRRMHPRRFLQFHALETRYTQRAKGFDGESEAVFEDVEKAQEGGGGSGGEEGEAEIEEQE